MCDGRKIALDNFLRILAVFPVPFLDLLLQKYTY